MEKYKLYAPCLFGLESVLAEELKKGKYEDIAAVNGSVTFSGTTLDIARSNISLRTAERICIIMGEFTARTFDDLFEGVKALPWEQWLSKTDNFPVTGHSINSKLFSVPDCQSIIKKAIVDKLISKYKIIWFEETGAVHKIRFSIMNDKVTVMLDTTGVGLHKRGYRPEANIAPIRETLAAGIIILSKFKYYERLCDPLCGSGTFAIEAAMIATNTAPGVMRKFSCEEWDQIPSDAFSLARAQARESAYSNPVDIMAFDIDKKSVDIANLNIKRSGFEGRVTALVADVADLSLPGGKNNVIVCNPPYGERMSELEEVKKLTKVLGKVFEKQPSRRAYIISSYDDFEAQYGKKADKNRKLYNGMIKTYLYQYYK